MNKNYDISLQKIVTPHLKYSIAYNHGIYLCIKSFIITILVVLQLICL